MGEVPPLSRPRGWRWGSSLSRFTHTRTPTLTLSHTLTLTLTLTLTRTLTLALTLTLTLTPTPTLTHSLSRSLPHPLCRSRGIHAQRRERWRRWGELRQRQLLTGLCSSSYVKVYLMIYVLGRFLEEPSSLLVRLGQLLHRTITRK